MMVNSTAIVKRWSLLSSSLPAMTVMLMLMMVMLMSIAAPPVMGKNYQRALAYGEQRHARLLASSNVIDYYRVTVPQSFNYTYFEVTFSACTATPIRIYYSSCVLGVGDCGLYRDHWFPNSTNAHRTHYSIEDPVLGWQQTLSFGRMEANEPNGTTVHYFGVEMEEGPSFADVLVVLRYYKHDGVTQTFTSSPLVDLDPVNKTLAWDTLMWCSQAKSSDTSECETEFEPWPIQYTVYIMRSDVSASVNANLATTCGLYRAARYTDVDKLVTSEHTTELNIASHVQRNGTYLVGVGARNTAQAKFGLDYAYRPLNLTIYRKANTKSGLHPALYVVPLVAVLVSALLSVVALTGVGIWHKRRRAAESQLEMLGEVSPLNGSIRREINY